MSSTPQVGQKVYSTCLRLNWCCEFFISLEIHLEAGFHTHVKQSQLWMSQSQQRTPPSLNEGCTILWRDYLQ